MPLRRFLAILFAISLLGSVATGVVVGGILKSGLAETERQLCHRLNVHRAADDVNAFATWNVNVLFAAALAHPLRGQPKQSAEQKRLTQRFRGLLERDISLQTWTPLTVSCDHPGQGSEPVKFHVRQPTLQDLTVGPGE